MSPSPSRRKRWGLAALVAVAITAPLLATVGGSPPAAGTEPINPTIDLVSPPRIEVESYDGWVYSDLALRLKVTGAPLEIWTQRADDYESVPTAVARLPLGDVTLPEQERVGALHRFVRLTFVSTDDPDAQPKIRRRDSCLGEATRTSPDSQFKNPYPSTCRYNPYALGSVQGIPSGWAASLFGWESAIRLRPGSYAMTARITKGYADALGLTPQQRTATAELVVKDGADCRGCREDGRVSLRSRPAHTEPDPDGGIDALSDLPPGTPVPDLRALPAFGIQVNERGTLLRFGANVWNGGDSPLVVDGFRRDGEDVMDAYQYFVDADGDPVAYRPVGTMVWHAAPSHNHWHFNDFATYELLNADKTRAVRSGKESFCLVNTDAVDLTVDGAAWDEYEQDLGSVCGGYETQSIREVLSSGWGDTYEQFRAGQAFSIKNLPDGIYWVRVLANPDGTLIERDTANNESLRKVRIFTTERGTRKVRVFPVGLIAEDGWFGNR